MDGIQTFGVGTGPVNWGFVPHPPAPQPTVQQSLAGLGSTDWSSKKMDMKKLVGTIAVSSVCAYAGYIADRKRARTLFTMAGGTLVAGTVWSYS